MLRQFSTARGEFPGSLSPADVALVNYARKVASDAPAVTAADIGRLKECGFSDAEVFDIAAVAAARAFWTKVLEALGVEPDAPFHQLDEEFRTALAPGRPLDFRASGAVAEAVLP